MIQSLRSREARNSLRRSLHREIQSNSPNNYWQRWFIKPCDLHFMMLFRHILASKDFTALMQFPKLTCQSACGQYAAMSLFLIYVNLAMTLFYLCKPKSKTAVSRGTSPVLKSLSHQSFLWSVKRVSLEFDGRRNASTWNMFRICVYLNIVFWSQLSTNRCIDMCPLRPTLWRGQPRASCCEAHVLIRYLG